MPLVEIVAAIAVLQFLFFGVQTGRARAVSGLKAPAMTGHDGFERMYRVQMNTLELMVAFLPSLFLAAGHWHTGAVAALGAVYVVGRFIYWRAYVTHPAKRGPGFALSILPTVILALMALSGSIMALIG